MNSVILELINKNKWDEAIIKANDMFIPLFNGKTIFHYACMRGEVKIIDKYLKLTDNKIYTSDDDGNTGFHLLAANEFDQILLDKLQKHPLFLKLKNDADEFIYNLVLERYDTFNEVLKLMEKNNFNKYLNYTKNGRTIILDVIDICSIVTVTHGTNTNQKYFDILKKFKKMNLNFDIPTLSPPLIYSIGKNYSNVSDYMLKVLKTNVNIKNDKQYTPLILAVNHKMEDLALTILNENTDVNYSGFENKYVPLSVCFKNGLINIAKKIMEFDNVDHDKKDTTLNTPIYYLIKFLLHNKRGMSDADGQQNEKIKMAEKMLGTLISKSDLQNLNINNETPFQLLVKSGLWKDYDNILANTNINVNSINKHGTNSLTYVDKHDVPKFVNLIEKTITNKNVQNIKENNVFLPVLVKDGNEDDNEFGLFNSDGIHNIVYLIVMLQKYKNLTIPIQSNCNEKQIWETYKLLKHSSPDDQIVGLVYSLVELYLSTFYCVLSCVIIWKDNDINYFCKDDLYLDRAVHSDHRFITFRITIVVDESLLHANIVIYDKQLNKLIRFEPYGDWEFHDSYSLDKLLIEMFKKVLDDKKKKSLKYIRPSDFLDKTKFQTTSMGDHFSEKSLGDPAGYCLAWCFWFLELKINNPDEDESILVESALNKIISSDSNNPNPLLTHIRTYAKQLDKEKNALLETIGINKKDLYKMSYSDNRLILIKGYIEAYANKTIG